MGGERHIGEKDTIRWFIKGEEVGSDRRLRMRTPSGHADQMRASFVQLAFDRDSIRGHAEAPRIASPVLRLVKTQ